MIAANFNQYENRQLIYTMHKLMYPFDDTNYIKIYSPVVFVERIEDKLNIEIKVNVIKNARIPDGFLMMDVQLPTQRVSNIRLSLDQKADDEKDPLPQSKHTPFIYKGNFTIDLNADKYFDREIVQEMVGIKLTFKEDTSYWKNMVTDSDTDILNFKKELYSQEVFTSFLYWNTIIYNGQEINVPIKEKFKNNKLVKSNSYKLNISLFKFNSPIIPHVFEVNNDLYDFFIYSRGYNLKFSNIDTGKEMLSIKSNINKKVDKYFDFDNSYDFNVENKKFVETTDNIGINMFNINSFNLSGCLLLKLNNTNIRLKINKNFYRDIPSKFSIKIDEIGKEIFEEEKFNEI